MKTSFFLFVAFLFLSCNSTDSAPPEKDPEVFETEYRVSPPEGFLPWPQHNPGWDEADVLKELVNNLFVINNFGQFQGFETDMNQNYFHSGVDIVAENGTPIFSVEDGTVVSLSGSAPYYQTLTIESENNTNYGWAYTHINDIAIDVGEKVTQGTFIGRINFQGLEHLHLERVKKLDDKEWTDYDEIIDLDTESYFYYQDKIPPIIKTPFHYFKNQTNIEFSNDSLATISGAVDIVAGMREVAPHSNDPVSRFGDRLGVSSISYKIIKSDSVLYSSDSFDFTKFEIRKPIRQNNPERVYKNNILFEGALDSYDKMFSYYIITNTSQIFSGNEDIIPNNAWNTLETNEEGESLYPNGLYKIEITASDSKGNAVTALDSVWVDNSP